MIVFIGFLIFIILVLLWFCIIASSRADRYAEQLRQQKKQYNNIVREKNTMELYYLAQKEALEAQEPTNAKH